MRVRPKVYVRKGIKGGITEGLVGYPTPPTELQRLVPSRKGYCTCNLEVMDPTGNGADVAIHLKDRKLLDL
jgi:hypothetical protein